ncbi:neuropeptide S receptor-like [Littorina saxatilis]|uniref:neuropeptide S receptor-like n=1 Tax=Littorina saxatilis TaxID=31220 RepID=UPI0038B618FF
MASTGSTPPSGSSMPYPYELTVASTIREVYIWVLLAVGLPCNAACVVTILFMHVNTATFYVALLAVADSLALIVKAIYHQRETPDAPSCYMLYINNFCSCYANWVLVLIVFQRFYAVCFPLRVKGAFTKKRIYISAATLAFALFAIIVVPTFYLKEWDEVKAECKWRDEIRSFAGKVWDAWIMASLYSYVPFLFIVAFITLIIVGLYRHRRARTSICAAGTSCSSDDGKAERAISIMLVCAGLVFLLLTLPVCLFHLFIYKLYDWNVVQEMSEGYLVYQVVTMLSDTNHAVNFFIYFLCGPAFRRQFLQPFQRFFRCSFLRRNERSSKTSSREGGLVGTGRDKSTAQPHSLSTEAESGMT